MKKAFTLLFLLAIMAASLSVKAQEVTILLNPGWTWIGYPGTDTLNLETAFGSFTPMEGDIIKAQVGNAEFYNGYGWYGTMATIMPGKGYMYKSNRTEPVAVTVSMPLPQQAVTTAEPTDITATSAVVGGTVTIGEGNHVFVRGVCWGTEEMPTVDDDHTSGEAVAGSQSIMLDGLTSSTIYYVRAYMVTDYGLVYGNQLNFTTESGGSGPNPGGEVQNLPYTQSFTSDFGTYMTYNVMGPQAWEIDYNTAKMSGYANGTNNANEDWLISSPVAITGVNDAKMTMVYLGRYFNNINEDVTIWATTDYTWGDSLAFATWTQVPASLTLGTNWSDFLTAEIDLTEYVGQTVTFAVRYTSTDSNAGTIEIESITIEEGSGVGPNPPGPGEGSGTYDDPYNVAAGIGLQGQNVTGWVHGYIVGAVRDGLSTVTSNADINWSAPFDLATNVVIADDASCREISQCIIVNLPAGKPLRIQVNLVDNPDNLGKHLAVLGTLRTYFSQAGLRDSNGMESDFVLEGDGGGDHAYVDLGLPSGLLWATCNVGAGNPEDYGDYFAWGETQPKDTYNSTSYQYSEDDAATANWGNGWRMPTKEEWEELYNNTTSTWTTQNGVNGRLFTANNGNSIFLPAAGYRQNSGLGYAGSYAGYWSSSLYTDDLDNAWVFRFTSGYYNMAHGNRYLGLSVRPVRVGSQSTSLHY